MSRWRLAGAVTNQQDKQQYIVSTIKKGLSIRFWPIFDALYPNPITQLWETAVFAKSGKPKMLFKVRTTSRENAEAMHDFLLRTVESYSVSSDWTPPGGCGVMEWDLRLEVLKAGIPFYDKDSRAWGRDIDREWQKIQREQG